MVVLPKEISEIVKEPSKNFETNPVGIMQTVLFACEADFEIKDELFAAAAAKVSCLASVSPEKIRELLENIISSKKAGKGLELLTRIGAMDYVLGVEISRHMSGREMQDFTTLVENIDKTKQTKLRRLALLYRCFNEKKAEQAIKKLNFSEEDEMHLLDGIYLLERMYFMTNKYEMKKFLVKYGMERYEFLQNLSKAQRIVYDLPVNKIESRQYVLDNIREYDEPIFEEDLAISREDLRELGIGKEEDYDKVFAELVDLAHIRPRLNTKEDMLEYAEKYCKHTWVAAFKKIRYIK